MKKSERITIKNIEQDIKTRKIDYNLSKIELLINDLESIKNILKEPSILAKTNSSELREMLSGIVIRCQDARASAINLMS